MILSYIYKCAFEFITNLTIISRNRDYIQTFCNDRRNTFHFAFVNSIHSIITRVHIMLLLNTDIYEKHS